MKIIKNDSMQSLSVYLAGPKGNSKEYWLKAGSSLQVPSSAVTEQVKNLSSKRLLKITNA